MTSVLNGQAATTEDDFRRMAEAGDTEASYNLGVLLERRGDRSEAANWYWCAAESGDLDAMFNLGGVLQDLGKLSEAQQWYRRAADAGDADAQANLELLRGRAAHPSATAEDEAAISATEPGSNAPSAATVRPTVNDHPYPTATGQRASLPPPPPPRADVAPSSWGHPATPPSEPKRPGRIVRRVLIGWNILAVIWLIAGIVNAVAQSHSAAANCSADFQQTCQSAYNVGALIGVAIVVFFRVAGDVILGVLYLVRGRGDRR